MCIHVFLHLKWASKRALKGLLCVFPACDHFQLANCQVVSQPFVMYAFGAFVMTGCCIVEVDVSKSLFWPSVKGQQFQPPGTICAENKLYCG